MASIKPSGSNPRGVINYVAHFLGLAITTMCIDLVGVQYIRKIHYFGRKINDAKTALAVVSGKVVFLKKIEDFFKLKIFLKNC